MSVQSIGQSSSGSSDWLQTLMAMYGQQTDSKRLDHGESALPQRQRDQFHGGNIFRVLGKLGHVLGEQFRRQFQQRPVGTSCRQRQPVLRHGKPVPLTTGTASQDSSTGTDATAAQNLTTSQSKTTNADGSTTTTSSMTGTADGNVVGSETTVTQADGSYTSTITTVGPDGKTLTRSVTGGKDRQRLPGVEHPEGQQRQWSGRPLPP